MEKQETPKKRNPTQFDLSAEARRILKAVAKQHGVSMKAYLEMHLREIAKYITTEETK